MSTPKTTPSPSPPPPAASSNNVSSYLAQMPLALLGSYLRGQSPSPSPSPSPAKFEAMNQVDSGTATPQRRHTINNTPSRPTSSSSSSGATDDKPKKRAPRPKTCYLFAKPLPTVNPYSKLHIRPKVLLQLHQVLAAERPKPVYDVIPFSLLEARATRRLARAFNTRDRLGHNDFLIVKVEEYGSKSDKSTSDDDRWGSREVIGVICPDKSDKGVSGKAEICMDDGTSRWEVTSLPNGGFEFNSTNEHGLAKKARWVAKPPNPRRWSGMSSASQPSSGSDDIKKFTFSTISPDSRRHPIIATMTRTRLDVLDSYAMPSATSPSTPSLLSSAQEPVLTPSTIDMDSFTDSPSRRSPITTDDALRKFIVVSGIWVISQTWTPDNSTILPQPPSLLNPSLGSRPLFNRTVSMSTFINSRSSSPGSICEEKRCSFPKLRKSVTGSLSRRQSFEAPSSPMSTKTAIFTSTPTPTVKTRPRRANSIATSNLHSMTGSMRKRYALSFENNTLPETEEEKQSKRSTEILRIKELALTSTLEQPSAEIPAEIPTEIPTEIPAEIPVTEPKPDPTPLPSPLVPESSRERKTQSAYNPIITAGMWDSGVTEGPGLKARPTSMFIINERKRKQEKKRGRSKEKEKEREKEKGIAVKEKEKEKDSDYGSKTKVDWVRFRNRVKGMFKRATC